MRGGCIPQSRTRFATRVVSSRPLLPASLGTLDKSVRTETSEEETAGQGSRSQGDNDRACVRASEQPQRTADGTRSKLETQAETAEARASVRQYRRTFRAVLAGSLSAHHFTFTTSPRAREPLHARKRELNTEIDARAAGQPPRSPPTRSTQQAALRLCNRSCQRPSSSAERSGTWALPTRGQALLRISSSDTPNPTVSLTLLRPNSACTSVSS